MDVRSKTVKLLKKYDLYAKKKLGQNFLISEKALREIVEAAELKKSDHVIEVGPGLGTLTEELTQNSKEVTCIELDKDMVKILQEEFSEINNLEIVNKDALKWEPPSTPYKVVANIPYYISSPLINHFLKNQVLNDKQTPGIIVLLVQKEVAKKICAKAGDHSVLSLNVQTFGSPQIITTVKGGAFHPAPKVDSAIIKIVPHKTKQIESKNIKLYFQLIETAFSQKRKKLTSSLRKLLAIPKEELAATLEKIGIDEGARPQHLSIKNWIELSKSLS